MKPVLLFIGRHPILSLMALLCFFPVSIFYGSKVEQDASVDGLIIEDEEKAFYDEYKERFGDDTMVSVMIKSEAGIFQDELLKSLEAINDAVYDLQIPYGEDSIPVVSHISSLMTVNKILDKDGFLDTDKLMDYLPEDEEELAQVKADTERSELLFGNLISKDLKTTSINLFLSTPPAGFRNYNQMVTHEIESILEKERARLAAADVEAELIQIGMPTVKTELAVLIEKDMRLLVPISLFVIFGILWYIFRSGAAILIPLFTGMTSVAGCLAFMSVMGYSINLISNIVPLLLLVIGCTEDIHMIADYHHQAHETRDKLKAIRNMLIKCSLATFLTSLTTVLGFLTLKTNPIQMLQEFGISAAVGLVLNYFITIIAVPTFLRFAPLPKPRGEHKTVAPWVVKLSNWLFHVAVNKRPVVVVSTILVIVFAVLGCMRIKVDADLISFFKPHNQVREKMAKLEENLSGGQSFRIVINTEGMGIEEGVKEPLVLRAMDTLETYLRTRFDYVTSVADYIKVFNREFNGGDEEYYRIPDTSAEVSQMLLLLEGNEMERLMDAHYENANIVVRHHYYGSWALKKELEEVNGRIQELFPSGISVRITGEGILFNKASDTMAMGQVSSLAIAVLIIFVIISMLFVSAKAGFLAMIPNAIPILMNFGIMGWFGMPLNPGTCTVAVIALGIAIDDTIHLMVQFYKELKINGDQKEAMRRTIDLELLPVISSSIALGLGFAVLIFADVVSSVQFGYLASIAMITALLSDILVTPALLVSTRLISSWDLLKTRINEESVKGSILFRGMKVSELKKIVLLGELHEYNEGHKIVSQGAGGREMYLILEGEVKVFVNGQKDRAGLQVLKRGDIFGEIAFLTGENRSANVQALGPVKALRIDEQSLRNVKDRFPKIAVKLFYNLSTVVGQRLRQTTCALKTDGV